jgi:hypothetical protein
MVDVTPLVVVDKLCPKENISCRVYCSLSFAHQIFNDPKDTSRPENGLIVVLKTHADREDPASERVKKSGRNAR